jgi:uncharacterized protein
MTAGSVPPELLDAVVKYFRPLRVILFGSAARGDAGPNSNIDLLVVLDDNAPPEKLTLAVFRRKSRIAGTLAYTAAREGRVVYERR